MELLLAQGRAFAFIKVTVDSYVAYNFFNKIEVDVYFNLLKKQRMYLMQIKIYRCIKGWLK